VRIESDLARAFLEAHASDASRFLEEVDSAAGASVLANCSPEAASRALQCVDPIAAGAVAARLPGTQITAVLSELSPDAAARVLRALDPQDRERMLSVLPEELARACRLSLDQPEHTAGARMDPFFLAVQAENTAREASERLRRRSNQTISHLYAVDQDHRPVGVVSLRELLVATPESSIASFMHAPVVRVASSLKTDALLALPAFRELRSLPVVDPGGALVGVVRYETIERLHRRTRRSPTDRTGSVGLEMMELFCSLTASTVDALTGFVAPSPTGITRRGDAP
jgi:magnesium transporter